MPKDPRSFFERLTGSVNLNDDAQEEETAENGDDFGMDADEEEMEETTSPNKMLLSKKRAVKEESAEPEYEKGRNDGFTAIAASSTATPVKSFFSPRSKTRHQEKVKTEKIEHAESENPKVSQEQENEIEGQLTVDIYDDGEKIVILSTVAGVRPEDLDIGITNDMITIKGRRRKQDEIKEDNYYYRELYWGAFSRSIILPEEIEVDKVEASLKHGILMVKLPKKNKHVTQKIRVKME